MLDSDQVTFPSFAPSLSQSPRHLRQSVNNKTLNSLHVHKMSINIPSNIISCSQEENEQNQDKSMQSISVTKNQHFEQESQTNNKSDTQSRVRIFCRLRPQNKQNYNYKYDNTMIDDGQNCYSFDSIFGKFASQQFLFKKIAIRHINDFMIGKNSTIFAYGQTGSGKTHTMFGDLNDPNQFGMIPRTMNQIFNRNNNQDIISCSMLEIYNQKLMDLFVPQQANRDTQELKLKQINDQIYIQGLVEVQVQTKEQILDMVNFGHRNRKVASTYNNDASSRSHTILFVYRTYYCQGIQQKSKLCFIDLAGSQKVRKSGVKGQTLEQAKKINLSLSCLGNVVHALTTNSDHVPYRNSKLTRILKDSLSGQTNTSIITTCSTDKVDYHETISTIKFAVRAKKIKNKKKLDNVQISMQEVMKRLKKQLDETKKQLNWYKMKQQLEKCNAVDIPEEDTCLLPLKILFQHGQGASSRIHRNTQHSQKFNYQKTSLSIFKYLGFQDNDKIKKQRIVLSKQKEFTLLKQFKV